MVPNLGLRSWQHMAPFLFTSGDPSDPLEASSCLCPTLDDMAPIYHCKLRVEAVSGPHLKPIHKLRKTTGSLEPCCTTCLSQADTNSTEGIQRSWPVTHFLLLCTSCNEQNAPEKHTQGKALEIWVAHTGNTFMGTLQPSLPPLPSLP